MKSVCCQYNTSPEMIDKNELKNGRTPEHLLSAEEKRKNNLLDCNNPYDDYSEMKKALEELEKVPCYHWSKEMIGLLIVHVFNDLISYLASRSVERLASYAEYLVKELPSRSRLFCLGVPKFEDTITFSKLWEEEETEKLITLFLCHHPLTSEITRCIHSFQKTLQDTVNSSDKKSPQSRREASIELPSSSMLLSSTSHLFSTKQHKRSFQIAFPTSPNWMLTPCKEGSATFFVDDPTSKDLMTSCHHVKNVLMLPSPRMRGTPGFYSLCRRFGTMHETSLDRALPETEDRHTKEHSVSSLPGLKNCTFSNDSFHTKENFGKENHNGSSTNTLHEKKDMSPHVSTCHEKKTSSSWSILNPSLGRVQNLIKHIESKSPLASLQKNSLINPRSIQNKNDRVNDSLHICSTPQNHLMQKKETCLQKHTSTKTDYDTHSLALQVNPPETFGATPIPVRKSVSNTLQYITETNSSPQQEYTLLDVQTPPSQKKLSLNHSIAVETNNSKRTSNKLYDRNHLETTQNAREEEEEECLTKEDLEYTKTTSFDRQIDALQETTTVPTPTQLKLHGNGEMEKEKLSSNQYLSKTTYKRTTSHDYGNFNRRYDFPSSISFGKPQNVNRDLIGLVYPQSRDEAEKIAKEVPTQILSVKCHEPYKLLPCEVSQQVCQSPNVSEKQPCHNSNCVSPIQSVYDKPVTKKEKCTSLCHVKGTLCTITQDQDSQMYHCSPKCYFIVSSPMVFKNNENKRLTPRFRTCERRMHRTLKKIQPKDFNDQADLSGEEDNRQVRKTGKKEASWAKNSDEWFLLVKNQLDIDPLSIFGCGVRPVLFEDIFQTPDFHRAAKDIEKNERLCQRAPDLLCQEGRCKQARKWYQDEQLCGFGKTDGVSKETIAKFRTRVGRLKDVSSFVWDSHWTVCDSSCVHNSSLRQPWFCKMATYASPLSNSSLRRTASHLNSEIKKHKSPLPLNQTNLSTVHEEQDEFLDDNLGCTTPEGYTRGIFCTTGPLTATRLLKLSGANRASKSLKKNILKENKACEKVQSGVSPKSFKTQSNTLLEKKLHQSDYLPSLGACPDFRFRSKNATKLHLTRGSPTQVKNSGLSLFSKFRDKL